MSRTSLYIYIYIYICFVGVGVSAIRLRRHVACCGYVFVLCVVAYVCSNICWVLNETCASPTRGVRVFKTCVLQHGSKPLYKRVSHVSETHICTLHLLHVCCLLLLHVGTDRLMHAKHLSVTMHNNSFLHKVCV